MDHATQAVGDAGFVTVVVGDPKNGKRRYINVSGIYPTRAKATSDAAKIKRHYKAAVDEGVAQSDCTIHVAAIFTEDMEGVLPVQPRPWQDGDIAIGRHSYLPRDGSTYTATYALQRVQHDADRGWWQVTGSEVDLEDREVENAGWTVELLRKGDA